MAEITVAHVDKWRLFRGYDGGPIEAESQNAHAMAEWSGADGDVRVEICTDYGTEVIYVPVAVLRAIIDQKETPTP